MELGQKHWSPCEEVPLQQFQILSFLSCRERQNRETPRVSESGDRDLTRAPQGAVPPPYGFLESELSDTGGETTETSLSEAEPDEPDEPISPPPPYTP